MIERKKIEKLHRYKIFYNEKRDAWYTCHPLNYKRRIQRKTKEELLDALAPFLTVEIGNDMTLTDLYPEWLDYKSQLTNSPNTIAVHEKHWNKYFKDTSLFLKPISTITLKDLNLWANALIKKWDLSSKQWQTIKTIPKQIFEYAVIPRPPIFAGCAQRFHAGAKLLLLHRHSLFFCSMPRTYTNSARFVTEHRASYEMVLCRRAYSSASAKTSTGSPLACAPDTTHASIHRLLIFPIPPARKNPSP